MNKFQKAAQLLGKVAEEAAPTAKKAIEGAEHLLADETRFTKELNRINARRAAAGDFELTPDQFRQYLTTAEVPKEKMVAPPSKPPKTMPEVPPTTPMEEGPQTLSGGSNKLFNPEMSGIVNYGAKKPSTAKAMMPLGAAQGLYKDLQGSALGDAVTQWSKIKNLIAGKAAKQMDLTGGKDPQFQEVAKDVLSTGLDPVNLIPGVGGVVAGGAEMLARDEEDENKKQKKP